MRTWGFVDIDAAVFTFGGILGVGIIVITLLFLLVKSMYGWSMVLMTLGLILGAIGILVSGFKSPDTFLGISLSISSIGLFTGGTVLIAADAIIKAIRPETENETKEN